MSKCEYEDCNGHCTLNECMYGDFLEKDDSRFDTGKYCYATCDEYKKAKERMLPGDYMDKMLKAAGQEEYFDKTEPRTSILAKERIENVAE